MPIEFKFTSSKGRGSRTSSRAMQSFAMVVCMILMNLPLTVLAAKIGSVTFTPQLVLSTEFNDNVNVSEDRPLEDLILRARLEFQGTWQITEANAFRFGFGGGYEKYINNSQLDRGSLLLVAAPESSFEFEVRLSEYMQLTLFDEFRFSRDPTDVVRRNDRGEVDFNALQYNRIRNVGGLRYTWELNSRNLLNVEFSRLDVIAEDDQFDSTNRTMYELMGRFTREFSSRVQGGVEYSVYDNDYEEDFQNDGSGQRISAFSQVQLSPMVQVSGSLGYSINKFETGAEIGDTTDPEFIFWNATIRHSPFADFSYLASYERQSNFGYTANLTRVDRISLTGVWAGFAKSEIRGTFMYDWGEDSGGDFAEDYSRYLFSLGTEFETGPNSDLSLDLRHVRKDSNMQGRKYRQNAITITWRYRF